MEGEKIERGEECAGKRILMEDASWKGCWPERCRFEKYWTVKPKMKLLTAAVNCGFLKNSTSCFLIFQNVRYNFF